MRAAGILFFISWILCGSCIDAIFEDPRALFVVVITLIVALCCMFRISREELTD